MYNAVPEDDKPAYDPKFWTNQTEAVNLVLAQARLIAKRKPANRRVVIFRGNRGAGKTWLLHRLEELLSGAEFGGFEVHFLDLAMGFDLNTLEKLLDNPSPQILLMDNVNRVDEIDLDILDDRLLAPMANRTDTLIVMAEAGPSHYWTTPLFREQSAEPDLKAFDRCDIDEQVRKLREQTQEVAFDPLVDVDLIARYGGGFPWSTYILALYLPDKKEALDRCVDALLRGVEDDLRTHFMALCVLKAFDDACMEEFLPHYPPLADEVWNTATCRVLRLRLLSTDLVRWQSNMRGYVIDEPVRLALEACFFEHSPDRWQALHCAAYHLYRDWADRYPQVSDWWQELKTYHHTSLARVEFNPANCPERLKVKEEETDGD